MEQIVLYLAILAALSGFAMGLVNLVGPFLKRHNITLPSLAVASLLSRSAKDDDDLLDQTLGEVTGLVEADLEASEKPLLTRRQRRAQPDDDDEELASVLDEVAQADLEAAEVEDDEDASDDDGTVIYTVPAEVAERSDGEDERSEPEGSQGQIEAADPLPVVDQGDDEEDGEDEDEDVETVAAAEPQVIAAGGGDGDDMMSFFNEASDAGHKGVLAWQEDLPEVSIEELLAEARAISKRIKGKKSDAA